MYKNKNNKNNKTFSKGGDINNKIPTPFEELNFRPLEVIIYNGNFDKALKAFKALVQKERILSLYKEKQSYEKPSQKKRKRKTMKYE